MLWSLYMLPLISDLRRLGLGCTIDHIWLGGLFYADDCILLVPTWWGGMRMLEVCEKWGEHYGIMFSVSEDIKKTKCKVMVVQKSVNGKTKLPPLKLYGMDLPYVEEIEYLGSVIDSSGNFGMDQDRKRAQYISSSLEIMQNFHFAVPELKQRAIKVYSRSFYGSAMWDLQSPESKKIYNCWRRTVKDCHGVDIRTHRYLVDNLLSTETSIEVDLASRYVKFYSSLLKCPSTEVNYLCQETETGLQDDDWQECFLSDNSTQDRSLVTE